MRLHTQIPVRNFALGLVSFLGTSISGMSINMISAPANAQSFPNDSVMPANTGTTQYLVYLPNVANIKQAKILASDAFVSRLDTGEQVVQLGRFNNLNLAQRRASQFSQAGLAPQIKTVQGRFATFPNISTGTIPPIPSNSAPIPLDSIPIPTSRVNDNLPGVPNSGFANSQSNAIEIIRSPDSFPQQNQPFSTQSTSQSTPLIASQGVVNAAQLRYFVIIPTGSVSELQRVQAIAPNAQLRSSYRGTYIELQGYPDRASAETLSNTVRRQGFDTRVVFF